MSVYIFGNVCFLNSLQKKKKIFNRIEIFNGMICDFRSSKNCFCIPKYIVINDNDVHILKIYFFNKFHFSSRTEKKII